MADRGDVGYKSFRGLGRHLHQVWRLSEYYEGNLGLACTKDGLFLGRTPLLERQGTRFAIRKRTEIERLLSRAYGTDLAVDRLLPGLATVTAALNANDHGLARIAAVHLRIPDLPDQAARDRMEAEDILLKSLDRESAPHVLGATPLNPGGTAHGNESFPLGPADGIRKASSDDPKHPGWPAGTEGGRGGQFRPKDASELTQKVKSLIARRALRTSLLAGLRFGLEALANAIPGVDVAADVLMAADIARTVVEFRKLAIDAAAALDFVNDGPHDFEDLQVSSSYEEFSSYNQFYKGELGPELLAKRFGPAGDGEQYHHIVTQGGANADNIPPEQLQSTDNIIRLPTILHEAVNAEYMKSSPDPSMNMYQWLQTKPYDIQREEGLKILRNLHLIK
jgi:hypothetical protein